MNSTSRYAVVFFCSDSEGSRNEAVRFGAKTAKIKTIPQGDSSKEQAHRQRLVVICGDVVAVVFN